MGLIVRVCVFGDWLVILYAIVAVSEGATETVVAVSGVNVHNGELASDRPVIRRLIDKTNKKLFFFMQWVIENKNR